MSRFDALAVLVALAACTFGCAGCDEASAKPKVVAPPAVQSPQEPPTSAASNGVSKDEGKMNDASSKEEGAWRSVANEALCTTSGAIAPKGEGGFAVDTPTFRAVSAFASRRAELAFVYRGATATTRALGSGAVRRQLGLKLAALNPCNLVYAIWRLRDSGEGELVVQWKHNVDQATSAQCGNRGYETIRPRKTAPLPNVTAGARHVLRAEIRAEGEGEILRVFADGVLSWEGVLAREAIAARGVVGVRSDNVRFEGELRVSGGEAVPCAARGLGSGDEGGE